MMIKNIPELTTKSKCTSAEYMAHGISAFLHASYKSLHVGVVSPRFQVLPRHRRARSYDPLVVSHSDAE
jgi:hypothetical protein